MNHKQSIQTSKPRESTLGELGQIVVVHITVRSNQWTSKKGDTVHEFDAGKLMEGWGRNRLNSVTSQDTDGEAFKGNRVVHRRITNSCLILSKFWKAESGTTVSSLNRRYLMKAREDWALWESKKSRTCRPCWREMNKGSSRGCDKSSQQHQLTYICRCDKHWCLGIERLRWVDYDIVIDFQTQQGQKQASKSQGYSQIITRKIWSSFEHRIEDSLAVRRIQHSAAAAQGCEEDNHDHDRFQKN